MLKWKAKVKFHCTISKTASNLENHINHSTLFLGLYAAAHDLRIEWVVIKGVSDYAGDNKSASDHWRPFSSLMASSLVAHILSNANVFQKWPHYKKPGT